MLHTLILAMPPPVGQPLSRPVDQGFDTRQLPGRPDAIAPDDSDVRVLLQLRPKRTGANGSAQASRAEDVLEVRLAAGSSPRNPPQGLPRSCYPQFVTTLLWIAAVDLWVGNSRQSFSSTQLVDRILAASRRGLAFSPGISTTISPVHANVTGVSAHLVHTLVHRGIVYLSEPFGSIVLDGRAAPGNRNGLPLATEGRQSM